MTLPSKRIGPVNLVDPVEGIRSGVVTLKSGVVEEIKVIGGEDPGLPYLLPGFVDPHIHGSVGVDFMSATEDDLEKLEGFLKSHGVCGCLLATVSAPVDEILKAADTLSRYLKVHPASIFKGVHVEGPHISAEKRGAHNAEYVRALHRDELEAIFSHPMVRMMTFAPELDGLENVVELAKRYGVILSIGHTAASFTTVERVMKLGVKRFTHLCNGMVTIHHREVGPVGAALLSDDAVAEIIVDGFHLSREMVQLIHRFMGDRLELITDATMAAGLEDGHYRLGSMEIVVEGGSARLTDGTLAGSTLTMDRAVKLFHDYTGAEILELAKVSSYNASTELGLERLGRLMEGAPSPLVEIGADFEYLKVHL